MTEKQTKKKRAVSRRARRRGRSRRPQWERLTAEALEEARATLGLSKLEWSEKLGASNSSYHNWLSGKATPSLDSQEHLAAVLEAAVAEHEASRAAETERKRSSTLRALQAVLPPPAPELPAAPQAPAPSALESVLVEQTARVVQAVLATPGANVSPRGVPALVAQVRAALMGAPVPAAAPNGTGAP